jgi:putative spermidine/putrescine transport system permease protein
MRSVAAQLAGWSCIGAILAFLMMPALVVFMASVSPTNFLSFPPPGISLQWYERALNYPEFRTGFQNSLVVAAAASLIAMLVGAACAYLLDRYEFPYKGALEGVLSSPLIIPHFTTGFGFLLLGASMGIMISFAPVVATHVVLVTPFVIRSIYISLRNIDRDLERAAANLGASPRAVLLRITLPLLAPGLVGGWMFAVILSLTEFTASLFVTVHQTRTLPVAMFHYIRNYTDPTVAAISAILILATTLLMLLANRLLGLNRILAIRDG